MGNPDWLSYGYSAAVTTGGIVGYLKAGSAISLGAGCLFGGLAGIGAYKTSQDPSNVWLSLGVSSSLTYVMGQKFYTSRKFMPSGLTFVLSTAIVAKSLYNLSLGSPTPASPEPASQEKQE